MQYFVCSICKSGKVLKTIFSSYHNESIKIGTEIKESQGIMTGYVCKRCGHIEWYLKKD